MRSPHLYFWLERKVDGQLQDIAFNEGQLVHQGEVLARLDARPFQAAFVGTYPGLEARP